MPSDLIRGWTPIRVKKTREPSAWLGPGSAEQRYTLRRVGDTPLTQASPASANPTAHSANA